MPEDPDDIYGDSEGLESGESPRMEESLGEEGPPLEGSVEEGNQSKVQAGMESQTEDFVAKTLKDINDDPFNDLRNELKEFKKKYDDPASSTEENRRTLDATLQRSIKLTSSRIAADYGTLQKNVETRTNVAARSGLILNPGAREYIDVLGRGERGQLVMFQLQNKTIASSIASGVRTSLEITTQFAPSAEEVYNKEIKRGDRGSMTTAIGILGPNEAFAEAVRKIERIERINDVEETERKRRDNPQYTSKLTKSATQFQGLRFKDGALMHAKLGYTESLKGSLTSAFLGTQNLTTSLDKASTQEEGLFLTIDESRERFSIKWDIANEIKNVSRAITSSARQMLNEGNGAVETIEMEAFQKKVRGILSTLDKSNKRKYVKVGDEIPGQNLLEFESIAEKGGKLALNMQYIENFLTATDYVGADSNWRDSTIQAFAKLAKEGNLSLTLSERSVNEELGYTRLIERLIDQKGDSDGKELIFKLVKKDRIRVIPTAFLHTKSFYEYDDKGKLIGVSTGSDNLASYEYTDPKRNFETRVYLDEDALKEVGVDQEDIAANTAFGEPGQMLAIQKYSSYKVVDKAYKSFTSGAMQEVNTALQERGIEGFTVKRRFRTDGINVFKEEDTSANLDKLASGLDITLSSGYTFGVTMGEREGYDYSKGQDPSDRRITTQDVVYLNKGNRAITGAVLLNRQDSDVSLQIPGRKELLKPGEATRLTALEVLNTMIYTLSSAQQYDSDISAPLRTLKSSNLGANQLHKDVEAILKEKGTNEGVFKLSTLKRALNAYDKQLLTSIEKNTVGGQISPALSTGIMNRFKAVYERGRTEEQALKQLATDITGTITRLLEGDISGPGYDVAAGYSDIVKLLIANDKELLKRYESELQQGRRTVFSQVVSSFFQPHESLFRGNQLAYQQPIFEVSGTTAALHGANNDDLSNQAVMMAVLSGSELSHYTKLNLIEGGSFIRTVQDSSRVKRVATPLRVGGMVFPEGGMTKITFGEGFMRSTSNLDYLTKTDSITNVWGNLDSPVRQLIEKTNEELFSEDTPELYYFPYAKTEQISARIKNKKSERGLLESSEDFTKSLRALGRGIKKEVKDPDKMLGGEIPVALSAEQFDILRYRYQEEGLSREENRELSRENLADLRRRQFNATETTQGFIGRSAPKMFLINMGVSTMSDFGYLNELASTQRMMIDVQRQPETFQTQELGPNFYAAVSKTLKAGTMFIAKQYEIVDEEYKALAREEAGRAFQSIIQSLGSEERESLSKDKNLGIKYLSAINKVLKAKNISVSLDAKGNDIYYLNSGVYRNINEGEKEKSLADLKRVGELTQDLTFIVYGLEKTTIVDGVQKSNYVPIVNSAIARRESRGVSVLKEDASLVSSGYAQQILEMTFATGMETPTGSRPVEFKGPLVYLSKKYFEKIYESIAANDEEFMRFTPKRLQTKQIEGVLAPSQIKDFNFTAGFALLEDPQSGLRGLLNNAQGEEQIRLGKEIAKGLELMLPSEKNSKSLFERSSTGIGTLNQYEGLALLTTGGESIEQGLKTIVERIQQGDLGAAEDLFKKTGDLGAAGELFEKSKNDAARELVERTRNLVNISYKDSLRYGGREIIKSNRYTRAASIVAILTSMASDLKVTASENTFSEVSFTEQDLDNYRKYLTTPEKLDANQKRRAQAQERLAYSMQINLREDNALETNFQYLNNLYSRNVFVRQYFEYGVSRIAVPTGMQDTTALEASYASYMSKAQMDLQTYDPNTREYVSSLQQAIFSLVINTQPLFGRGESKRFAVERPRSLLTQGLKKKKEYVSGKNPIEAGAAYQRLESFALVNSFTNAYSLFGRRDLPDVEDGGFIAPNHVVDVIEGFLTNNINAGKEKKKEGEEQQYGAKKLSKKLRTELKQMGKNKSLVMALPTTGVFENDIEVREIYDSLSKLLQQSLERKVSREKSLLNSINEGHNVGDQYIKQPNTTERYTYYDLDNQEKSITPKAVFRRKKESIDDIESKPAFTESIGDPIIGFLIQENGKDKIIHVNQLGETDSLIRQEASNEVEIESRIASLKRAPSGERSQWDISLESMYNRINQTKLSLKSSEGTSYLEALTVLQRQTEGQLKAVNKALDKNRKNMVLKQQQRDLRSLNRELIKTSVYTLPQLGALGVETDTGKGRFVIDNTRPVMGAILGLDILKEIKLAFHGYTHNVLEDQAKLRGLLAEAESTGLFRVLAQQVEEQPKDGVIKLTREQSNLYTRISEQMASSNYNTRELFNNQENLRRLEGDRLKQSGTTFVAFSSFLVGPQEYAAGTRADRINEIGSVSIDEIASNEIFRSVKRASLAEDKAREAGFIEAATYLRALLKNNQVEGFGGMGKRKVGASSKQEELIEFLKDEHSDYDDEDGNIKHTGDQRLREVLKSIEKKGQTYALANRTGAPNYSSEASGLYYLENSINDLNARTSEGDTAYNTVTYSNFQFSTRLSTTALALPAMGLQYTQLGDYDGDTFQLAFNRLSSIALQMQRLKGQMSKMDPSDSARQVVRGDRDDLMKKFMELYAKSSELTSQLEDKAKAAQDSFTRNFMILPQEIVTQLSPEQQATLVKQYRDSLSGSYGAAGLVRKNFTRYVEHFLENDKEGIKTKEYSEDLGVKAGLTSVEHDAEKAYVEGLLRERPSITKAALIQSEADRINLEAAEKNIRKSLSSAAGSIISPEQLEILQATVGTSGMGLLGEIYNTVTPMVDLAQGDRLQLLALNDEVLSERLIDITESRSGLSGELLKNKMKTHYEQRLSNAYRFSVLTQQFMRDAALKPKEGGGVLEIAATKDADGMNLYERLSAQKTEEARKSTYKKFLANNVGLALSDYAKDKKGAGQYTDKTQFNLSAFGALTLLQEYVDSGKNATQLIGGESLLSEFLARQKTVYQSKEPGMSDDAFMANLLTDLTNSFQREYLVSGVLEAKDPGMQTMLSDLGGLIESYGRKEGGEYSKLLTQTESLTGQERDVALYEGLMKIQQEEGRSQSIQQLRSLKRFKEGSSDYERVMGGDDAIVQALGAKITRTELNIRRGKATQEDITDFVGVLTSELPEALRNIEALEGPEKSQALFGLSTMLEAGGLMPSFVQEEIDKLPEDQRAGARNEYIKGLVAGGENSVASKMAELSGFSYLQANLRSRGEILRNQALTNPNDPTTNTELNQVEQDLSILEQKAGREGIKAVVEEMTGRYGLDTLESRFAEEQALEDAANRVSKAAAGAAINRTSQQVRRSHNRGEILSILAVPLIMGSLQGGTMSVEQLGILASNVVQGIPMLSSYEGSSLYGALHGNDKVSRTELNRSQAVEAQFYRARSRDFIRSNENKLEGLLQATAFEGISRAAGRVTVAATQEIANRFGDRGFFTSGGIGRGVSELLGGLAGMAVAGVITQRPITGTGQNMGSLPGYVLKTLNEISQTVQGAAQRYLQDLIEEGPEVSVDNEQVETTAGEISENFDSGSAFSGDVEKDWWSGWASPEEGVLTFDSMETASESIELGDSPEIT